MLRQLLPRKSNCVSEKESHSFVVYNDRASRTSMYLLFDMHTFVGEHKECSVFDNDVSHFHRLVGTRASTSRERRYFPFC